MFCLLSAVYVHSTVLSYITCTKFAAIALVQVKAVVSLYLEDEDTKKDAVCIAFPVVITGGNARRQAVRRWPLVHSYMRPRVQPANQFWL